MNKLLVAGALFSALTFINALIYTTKIVKAKRYSVRDESSVEYDDITTKYRNRLKSVNPYPKGCFLGFDSEE